MHIPDGILPLPVTLGGYGLAFAVTWFCLHKIKQKEDPREDIPKASLLTAAFFVASLIHIPIPPTSVHLLLSGLMGALLGFFAIPAILIGLFFQAVMFGHGGLTTLGVNTVILGFPALAAHYIFRMRNFGQKSPKKTGFYGFLAGSAATALSVLLFTGILLTTIPADMSRSVEQSAIFMLIAAHIPLIIIEGIVTSMAAVFLLRVSPRMLQGV
ncbi:MAG: cobalt transporter CbiM [Desulfonatronovibrio sp.]